MAFVSKGNSKLPRALLSHVEGRKVWSVSSKKGHHIEDSKTPYVKNSNYLNELTSFNAKYGHGENHPHSRSEMNDSDVVR